MQKTSTFSNWERLKWTVGTERRIQTSSPAITDYSFVNFVWNIAKDARRSWNIKNVALWRTRPGTKFTGTPQKSKRERCVVKMGKKREKLKRLFVQNCRCLKSTARERRRIAKTCVCWQNSFSITRLCITTFRRCFSTPCAKKAKMRNTGSSDTSLKTKTGLRRDIIWHAYWRCRRISAKATVDFSSRFRTSWRNAKAGLERQRNLYRI